jgi:hypothetical protein
MEFRKIKKYYISKYKLALSLKQETYIYSDFSYLLLILNDAGIIILLSMTTVREFEFLNKLINTEMKKSIKQIGKNQFIHYLHSDYYYRIPLRSLSFFKECFDITICESNQYRNMTFMYENRQFNTSKEEYDCTIEFCNRLGYIKIAA